jgi:hypothetical protein
METELPRFFGGQAMPNKRQVMELHTGGKRNVRHDEPGLFANSPVNVSRSLSANRLRKAKTNAPKGQGDRGDQKHS